MTSLLVHQLLFRSFLLDGLPLMFHDPPSRLCCRHFGPFLICLLLSSLSRNVISDREDRSRYREARGNFADHDQSHWSLVETPLDVGCRGQRCVRSSRVEEQSSDKRIGTIPVTPEDRTDSQYYKNFLLWFSWNCNILTFSAGSLGPAVFGLSVRDSCLVILFSNLLCVLPPAYL